jgi:hypothetical protein
MIALGKCIDSMERQPRWTAPHDNIAAFQPKALGTFISCQTAEEKFGRQS